MLRLIVKWLKHIILCAVILYPTVIWWECCEGYRLAQLFFAAGGLFYFAVCMAFYIKGNSQNDEEKG